MFLHQCLPDASTKLGTHLSAKIYFSAREDMCIHQCAHAYICIHVSFFKTRLAGFFVLILHTTQADRCSTTHLDHSSRRHQQMQATTADDEILKFKGDCMSNKTELPDLTDLLQALIAMRDSLVQTSLALQDLHYEMDAEHRKLTQQVNDRMRELDRPSSLQLSQEIQTPKQHSQRG